MNLQDVFDQLSSGELSQISLGGLHDGGICESNKPRVIHLIQSGLTAIYTRFELKQAQVVVELHPGRDRYNLNSKFVKTNMESDEPIRYLLDSDDQPFRDRLIKVTQVMADNGQMMALNLRGEPYSVSTPTYNTLSTPSTIMTADFCSPAIRSLLVEYKSDHPKIDMYEGPAASDYYQLELPEMFLTALSYYVASRVLNPMGMTNEFYLGGSFSAKYEQECQRLEMEGADNDSLSSEGRFARSGFV